MEIEGKKVTPTEARVYAALSVDPEWSHTIAQRAGLRSMSMGEAGARYCISLTKKGLAIKHGTRSCPKWSKAEAIATAS
jgi:hypothetical protein